MDHKLTATEVKNFKLPRLYNDGAGLYLKVTQSGTRSWIFRYRDLVKGNLRDMGLGSYPTVGLADARLLAETQRKVRQAYLDPIKERDRRRAERQAEASDSKSFDQAAEACIEAHSPGWKNPKHVQQWRNTLKTYASPVIGSLPVSVVTTDHVIAILNPIWVSKTETASRLRGRIESVLSYATAMKWRTGSNPAQWRGLLDQLLPKPSKVAKSEHHPALPFVRMHEFMADLASQTGISARCLEFTILTACRTSEAIVARWEDFDPNKNMWTIPAEITKSGREHRVPLSEKTAEVLNGQYGFDDVFVFPGMREGSHLSNMAMLSLIKDMHSRSIENGRKGYTDPKTKNRRITVHGFRSSFKDWASEMTTFPGEVQEMSLAHVIGDKTEEAYRRGDLFVKRVTLMDAWAAYCETGTDEEV